MRSSALFWTLAFPLVLLCSFNPSPASGQSTELDSLYQVLAEGELTHAERAEGWIRISQILKYSDPDSAFQSAKGAVPLAYLSVDSEIQCRAESQLATIYAFRLNRDSATYHFRKAKRLAVDHGFTRGLANALTNESILYYFLEEKQLARDTAAKAVEIAETLDDSTLLLRCYNNAGVMFRSSFDYGGSMSYYLKALEISLALGDDFRTANLYSNIGRSFSEIFMFEEAQYHYEQALTLLTPEQQREKVVIYYNLGINLTEQEKYDEALEIFKTAIAIPLNTPECYEGVIKFSAVRVLIETGELDSALSLLNTPYGLADCDSTELLGLNLLYRGLLEVRNGEMQSGIVKLESALRAKPLDLEEEILAHEELAQAYAAVGQYDSAYKHEHYRFEKNKSRRDEEQLLGISRAEYEYELKLQSEMQEKEVLLLESSLLQSEERSLRLWVIGVLGVLLSIGFVIFGYRQRSARRIVEEKNRTITLQQEELKVKANLLSTSYSRIQELSNFKERLAHMAVHDMKNPLHRVIGLASGNADENDLRQIRFSAQHILDFLTNILDIYKFEQARVVIDKQPVHIDDLLQEAKSHVQVIADLKSVKIEVQASQSATVPLDESLITRVLVNLLNNAIKYSSRNGKVQLEAHIQNETDGQNELELIVRDYGAGISEEHQATLFSDIKDRPSVRIEKSMSTGLGLNFCQLAVKAHGGTIRAESVEGEGTTFYITLPIEGGVALEGIEREVALDKSALIHENEKQIISDLAKSLKGVKVYEVGRIHKILNDPEVPELQSPWKKEVELSVFAGEEQKYSELVNLAAHE